MSEQQPPGTLFGYRATVLGETADELLANLSRPTIRNRLPGFLYLFSEQQYRYNPAKAVDGFSADEHTWNGYKRRTQDFNRNKFSLTPFAELKDDVLRLKVQLGFEAAKRIIQPPFFESADDEETTMVFEYEVRGSISVEEMKEGVGVLKDYLETNPRGIIDELVLIDMAMKNRKIAVRDRQRPKVLLNMPNTVPPTSPEVQAS